MSSSPDSRDTILFLCTGNYYRSRFAELLFNALAARAGVRWRADSRALAIERGEGNEGPIAADVIVGLTRRGVSAPHPHRFPLQVEESDLAAASRIIALCRREHEPIVLSRLWTWRDRVHYWDIEDGGVTDADTAFDRMHVMIEQLLKELA